MCCRSFQHRLEKVVKLHNISFYPVGKATTNSRRRKWSRKL